MTETQAPLVCGIDFSPESQRALVCAAALANRLGCALHVVSAVEPLLAEAARSRNQLSAFTSQVARDLREFAGHLPLPADRVICDAADGEPVPVLLAAGAKTGARLIVVGTRGRGHAARIVMGSTTLRLLRATDRPVLVTDWSDRSDDADPAANWAVSRIVCGVDFSSGSIAAVASAARLAADLGATIKLVHAVSRAGAPVSWDPLVGDVDSDRLGGAMTRLADVARQLNLPVNVDARLGSTSDVLAEETHDDPHAIIAVGLHGAGLHRPGSTAIKVVAATRVPVLAVPE